MPFSTRGLYAITDSTLMPDDETMLAQLTQALDGGARIVQYRDKSSDSAHRLRQAQRLNELCTRYAVPLLINDDVELALASGAAGVHLGQQDGSLTAARQRLGSAAIIGITCHDQLDLALQARAGQADYVAFGAFFPSATKPEAKPAPLSLLHRARQQLDCPIVAIGGISVDNAAQIIEAGADMVAVIHALFASADIQARAEQFARLFNDSPA